VPNGPRGLIQSRGRGIQFNGRKPLQHDRDSTLKICYPTNPVSSSIPPKQPQPTLQAALANRKSTGEHSTHCTQSATFKRLLVGGYFNYLAIGLSSRPQRVSVVNVMLSCVVLFSIRSRVRIFDGMFAGRSVCNEPLLDSLSKFFRRL